MGEEQKITAGDTGPVIQDVQKGWPREQLGESGRTATALNKRELWAVRKRKKKIPQSYTL